MSRSILSSLCIRSLQRCSVVSRQHLAIRSLSTIKVDPSTLVDGVTVEKMAQDPNLQAFMEANFPYAFEGYDDDEGEDGVVDLSDFPPLVREQVVEYMAEEKKKEKKKKQQDSHVYYPRNIRPLWTYKRFHEGESGSARSRNLRWDNMIPGIIRGSDPFKNISSSLKSSNILIKTPWTNLQKEVDKFHRNFESRVYNLTVYEDESDKEGTVHCVMPQGVQYHPVKKQLFCANFVRYHAKRKIKIPIKYINEEESPAMKRDGFIVPIQRKVEVTVEEGVDIPEFLECECTGLNFKAVIRKDRLTIPDGVHYSDQVLARGNEYILGVVFGRSRDAADMEDEAKEEATA